MAEKKAIYKVKTDAGYDEIHFKTIASQVIMTDKSTVQTTIDNIINLNLDTMLELRYGMKGNGTDEAALLQKALDENNIVYIPRKFTVGVKTKINITGNKKIISDGGTIKCLTPGLDDIIYGSSVNGLVVSGVNFDMNNMGRTSIAITDTTGYLIEKCSFTGFSAESGIDENSDGGIKIDKSTGGIIAHNTWINHGDKYGTDTKTLNRCISVNGSCDNTLITGNTFKSVNQAIVTDSKNIRIANNHFEDVKDNSVYCVGQSENIIIEGNTFKDGKDECIVLSGAGGFAIDNNIFDETTNKIMAINGPMTNVSITDNIVKCNTKAPANVISWRSENGALKDEIVSNFVIVGNIFEISPQATNPLFIFGSIDGGICEDNYFKFNRKDIAIRFSASKTLKWLFRNNNIQNINADASNTSIFDFNVNPTTKDFVLDNCKISGGRITRLNGIVCKNMMFQSTSSNVYLTGLSNSTILWGSGTPNSGTWNVGDIIYNIQPSALGHIGWVCTTEGTPGTWSKFGKIE